MFRNARSCSSAIHPKYKLHSPDHVLRSFEAWPSAQRPVRRAHVVLRQRVESDGEALSRVFPGRSDAQHGVWEAVCCFQPAHKHTV